MKPFIYSILALVAIVGVFTCAVDENKKGSVGGVSYDEIARNQSLVRKSEKWKRMAQEVR